MKKIYAIIMMAASLAACVQIELPEVIEEPEVVEEPGTVQTYTLTVEATKGGDEASKALSLTGKTLNATWTEDDAVDVYNSSSVKIGTLLAKDLADGGLSCTLRGSLDSAPSEGETLTLKYLSPNYDTQDGTLTGNETSIDKVCDYAIASVDVISINGTSISASNASFTNQQAIVKFTLIDKADDTSPVNATQLSVSDGTDTYTIIPASATNELYVALPGFSDKTVTITATDGNYNYNYEKSGVTFTNGKYYAISVKASVLQGSGKNEDPFLISSEADWNYLDVKVNSGTSYANKYFRQTANIDVTTMVGNSSTSRPFSGTYDGDGKTLNLSLNTTEPHTAPFRLIANATIKNVVTTGSVYSTSNHPSGLVGATDGPCTIQNCRVSANVGGAQHSGGIVGHSMQADISIIGCVYSGTLSPASGQKTGGLLGWGGDGGGHTMTISNCLFAGSLVGSTQFHPIGIVQNTDNTRTVSNSYYTLAANIDEDTHGNSFVKGLSKKGKFARSITAGSDVTVANAGAETIYDVSGITSYGTGILYDGVLYAGNGEEVSLTLSHADAPAGFVFSQYTVSGGGSLDNPESNSPTLTMGDANQTINAQWSELITYTAPTLRTGLTFNGNQSNVSGSAQNLVNAGSVSHGTIYYSTNGWCTLSPTSSSGWGSIGFLDSKIGSFTVTHHGGELSYVKGGNSQDQERIGVAHDGNTFSLTCTKKVSSAVTITVTSAATTNYNAASATYTCNL